MKNRNLIKSSGHKLYIADIPVYKKQDVSDKTNYRPISLLLPIISKVFPPVIWNFFDLFRFYTERFV